MLAIRCTMYVIACVWIGLTAQKIVARSAIKYAFGPYLAFNKGKLRV